MEGTGIHLTQEVKQPPFSTFQEDAFLLWKCVELSAAQTRLKLLSRVKDRPEQIDREFSNIHTSINWLISRQDFSSAEILIQYIETLETYLHLRGHASELVNWCIEGLTACNLLKRDPSHILLILGNAQYALGQWEQANESWLASIESSNEKDAITHAHAVFAIGRLQINQGNYKTALKTLAKAEKLLSKVNETQAIINVQSEVAAYYLNRKELEKALNLFLEIAEFERENTAKVVSNHTNLMLGIIYRQKKEFNKAIEYLSMLCQQNDTQKDISSLATGTHHLAWVYFELRDLARARNLCGKALSLYKDLHDPRGLSDGYEQLGAILLEEGKLDEAIDFLEKSAQMRKLLGNQPGYTSSMRRLVLAYVLRGESSSAWKLLPQILKNYLRFGIMSRQRFFSLLKDFFIGIGKAVFERPSNVNLSSATLSRNATSTMESFSRFLIRPKK